MNSIYENEWVKLYQGDCLEIMPKLDITFDACITDPPYGTTSCKWDSVIPFEPMWENLKRLVKDNGAICLFGSEPFSSKLRCSNLEMFKYDWIWEKTRNSNPMFARKRPLNFTENISVFSLLSPIYFPIMENGEKYATRHRTKFNLQGSVFQGKDIGGIVRDKRFPKNILRFKSCYPNTTVHNTQKPVALIEYLVKTYTNENDIVLDFTAGSGTTGIACMETNRRCVLIEKEEKYCEITIKRLQDKEKEIAERLF